MSLLRSLGIVEVIRYKEKQWNQTRTRMRPSRLTTICAYALHYSLNSDRLAQFLNQQSARSTEISEMCNSLPQNDNDQHLKVSDSELSFIDSKNTSQKRTAKQKSNIHRFSAVLRVSALHVQLIFKHQVNC